MLCMYVHSLRGLSGGTLEVELGSKARTVNQEGSEASGLLIQRTRDRYVTREFREIAKKNS